jgi:hypothetical protein
MSHPDPGAPDRRPIKSARSGRIPLPKLSGEFQFPHIRGVIYMSYRMPTDREGMPFWVGGVLDENGDRVLHELQQQLKTAWYQYLEMKTGVRITERPLGLEKQ